MFPQDWGQIQVTEFHQSATPENCVFLRRARPEYRDIILDHACHIADTALGELGMMHHIVGYLQRRNPGINGDELVEGVMEMCPVLEELGTMNKHLVIPIIRTLSPQELFRVFRLCIEDDNSEDDNSEDDNSEDDNSDEGVFDQKVG